VHRLQRLLAVALLLVALPASAQYTRDNAANKKIDEAINTHYLSTDFDKAEGVLTGTVNACADKCSPQVIAKAWMYVGIVRGSGKNDQAGAKEAFQKALAADPNVKLDAAIATAETQKTFENAGGAGGAAPPPPPAETAAPTEAPAAGGEESGEGVACSPDVRDIQTRRPIPVQCTTDEEATSLELRYKPFGGDTWKSVKMDKKGDSYQALVPCTDTEIEGTLRVYVRAKDAGGETLGSWGTKNKPIEMNLAENVAAEPPSFDGEAPPERCQAKEECPPDFPGCDDKKGGGGTVDWGGACENSSECKSGLLCTNNVCETAPSCSSDADCETGSCIDGKCAVGGGDEPGPTGPFKRHWVGIHVAQDIAIIGGSDVCTPNAQANENFACFYEGGEEPFAGLPFPGTGIQTGTVVATTRFLLSYDFAFSPNLTLGARAGYAIGGGPPAAGGTKFLPVHAEGRATYWFGRNALGKAGLRPYVAIGGGMAQVDAKVKVTVKDCNVDAAAGASPLDGGTPIEQCIAPSANFDQTQMQDVKLDAYKKLGQGFVTGAAGLAYAFSEKMALQLNVNFMYMLPSSGAVIEPSLGFTMGL
jgi:hypothetical protein